MTYIFILCLFVCLGFIVPLQNFSLIWRRHHYWWRAANFDLCSALMAIEQWRFFSMPHLELHGASVPVTLTPSSGAVTTWFYDLCLSRLGFEHPTFCLRGQRSNPLHHHRSHISTRMYCISLMLQILNLVSPVFRYDNTIKNFKKERKKLPEL